VQNHSLKAVLAAGLLCAVNSASAEVTKLAELRIPAQSTDQSNLTGKLDNGMPLNQFGGIGALSWAGENVYYLLPDRGPDDGAVPYPTRFHKATFQFTSEGAVEWKLLETHLLTKDSGEPLVGAASALKHGDKHPGRLDPEGIRFVRQSEKAAVLAISDEYGPRVDLYDLTGKRTRKLKVPGKFEIEHPSGNAAEEAQKNDKGRQPNAGFEALGVSPDGGTLYAMNQRPLIQDGAIANGRFTGLLNRILRIDIESEDTAEFVYPLENSGSAVCELLMIDDHRALILERDSLAGPLAKQKSLYLIDLHGASDVSEHKSLPAQAADLPTEVRAVSKRLFADLLDPKFGIAGESTPAKFEGLTFGPDLPDGRRTLVISVDNDFRGENPTVFYFLALEPVDLK
jgi:hypothetical protein